MSSRSSKQPRRSAAGGVSLVGLCRALHLAEPVPEYKFHETRRWRFDWAFPAVKLAVEVQGGMFVQGRHTQGAGLRKEYEKLNAAATLGWSVLFVFPEQLANGTAMALIEAALTARGKH